jgi:glycosyltransferase involved in cell wall biosynthesis
MGGVTAEEAQSVSVVIPAFNAERTLGAVLDALTHDRKRPDEVIVVDDGSTDLTAQIARAHGARVVDGGRVGYAGGARNRGWDAATGEVVVFLDSDAVPLPGFGEGVRRAAREFPGAIVGCARRFAPHTAWSWVAHLQIETPYLERGRPRDVKFVSSYCMLVPRALDLRFDESYGGEDAVFSADALDRGIRLVFDPRYAALHDHDRDTFAKLRRQQARVAFAAARIGPVQREGTRKRIASRVPLHYFALMRLPVIYRRLDEDPALRRRFVRLLPLMAVGEWTLGAYAVRYAVRPRPRLRDQGDAGFR